jgi:uncharacterized protein (TIGR00369 family)
MAGGERGDGMFERVRESFARQGIMGLLGARISEVGEGRCVVEVPYSDGLAQQQRYFHGAVAGAIADSAAGYVALTLAPEGREVLTVEYKINFLAPRGGEAGGSGGGSVRRSQVVRLQGRGVHRLRRGRRDAVRRAPTDHSHHPGVNRRVPGTERWVARRRWRARSGRRREGAARPVSYHVTVSRILRAGAAPRRDGAYVRWANFQERFFYAVG